MLDARTGCSRTDIMSLVDSPYAAPEELFTAACSSALHPMHAIAASTHYIRVFDQRYLAHPVVAWRHNLSTHDPPIYLQTCEIPQYEDGQAAVILAASEQSSLVASYVYGQHAGDQPYVSIEQGMLKASTKSARIGVAIQDLLAVDVSESPDMLLDFSYVPKHLTARLSGLSLQLLPREPKVGRASVDAVCMTADESGAVVGRRLLLIPRSRRQIGSKPSRLKSTFNPVFKAPIWTDFRRKQGAVVDGMGLVLYDKAHNDMRKEQFWAELRKRVVMYKRVDMRVPYRYLLGTTNATSANGLDPNNKDGWRDSFAIQLDNVAKTQVTASVSGLDLTIFANGALSNAPNIVLKSELPSWSASGEGIRDAFLLMQDGELLEVKDVADCVYSNANGAAKSQQANGCQPLRDTQRSGTYSELERIFGTLDSPANVHVSTALARAAKDIELQNVRVRSAADAAQQANRHITVSRASAESDILPRLDAMAEKWSVPARQLGALWSVVGAQQLQTSNAQVSSEQYSRSQKKRPDRWMSSATVSQNESGSSQQTVRPASQFGQAPMAPPVALSLSRSMDAFAFASQSFTQAGRSQQPSQLSQAKKKTRRAGF
ncbi:hypothetical protein GGI21_001737 [Coemansia aciculifera]|nr:hypothetical protein GGI21_001737 [Coemansia aciculifera]